MIASMQAILSQPGAYVNRAPVRRCVVSGCGQPHHGRGVCKSHYERAKRRGKLPKHDGPDGRAYCYRRQRVVPMFGHPITRFIFEEAARQQIQLQVLAGRAGISRQALEDWRKTPKHKKRRHDPRLSSLEACLNVLGYTLGVKALKEAV